MLVLSLTKCLFWSLFYQDAPYAYDLHIVYA